jgi:RNA polymerase sigma-70 factor (ECF subfamily)
VLRSLPDPDTAEDIVQDTLLSVLMNLKRLRNIDSFWPWIYRIARCKTQDYLRRHRLHSVSKATLALNRSSEVRPNDGSILDAKIHEERLRQVAEEVDQLSYEHRDIIKLRFYEQLSYEQIASRTQISPKIARARTFRAKKCLKACLV